MQFTVNDHNIFAIVFVTFMASALFVPIVRKTAIHIGAMDIPNKRKVHHHPIPRLGGLAVFFSFLLGYMLYARSSIQMLSILIGGFIIIVMGMVDDIKPIRARYKFLMQIVAASVVAIYGQMLFNDISIFGISLTFPYPINYIITIIFIVAITNAINLIDGIDGLSSGIASIYFLTIAVIAVILNKFNGLDITLSLIMLGATLGFLLHNFPPASIFIGDTGSNFIGFMISVIALIGFKTATISSLIVPLVILAIPITDTLLAIFRRLLKGESIAQADKEHLHHQLLNMKFSTRKTVLIIYMIDILFALVSIFYVLGDGKIALLIYLFLMVCLLFLVLKTNILFDHKKK